MKFKLSIFLICPLFSFSQKSNYYQDLWEREMPFISYFGGNDEKILKKDSFGVFYKPKGFDSLIFYRGQDNIYKLYDLNYNLKVSGFARGGCPFYQFGLWTSYYPNKNIKTKGSMHYNQPIGLWQFYYENGNLEKEYTISFFQIDSIIEGYCKVGPYKEYYDNGNIKIEGIYGAKDSLIKEKYRITEKDTFILSKSFIPKKILIWKEYSIDGKLKKEIEYSLYGDRILK
jgi:antitoxin component YwqK of YwqJK toxin-antitoxin module